MKRGSFHLDINTTKNCNLRCSYCFEVKNNSIKNKSFGDVPALMQFIDDFMETHYFEENYKELVINFWGGEPTMNVELFKEIVYKYIDNNRVRFFMYSNGFHMDDFYISMFKELQKIKINGHHKMVVQISFDGQPLHDFERVTVNNKGSSDSVRKTINKLKENNIYYVLKGTISPENFKYLYDAYLDVISLSNNGYFPTIDLHREYNDDSYKEFGDDLYESLIKIATYELKHNSYKFKWFKRNRALCSAGANLLAVDINGNILPCHGALYTNYDEHLITNISDDDAVEKFIEKSKYFDSINHNEPENCKQCPVNFCLRCNITKFEHSKMEDYGDKWTDHDNQQYLCYYFLINDKVLRSVNELKKEMYPT